MAVLASLGQPSLDDNLYFLEDTLGLDLDVLASSAELFCVMFHAGSMVPLIKGTLDLLALDTFQYDPVVEADAEALGTERLFNVLEIYEAIDEYGVLSASEARKLGIPVYRYGNVFAEMAFEAAAVRVCATEGV
jgi:hypothetical protein